MISGGCEEKPPVHVVTQAAPEQIKKAAIAMFARSGYTLDSLASPPWHTPAQLKISKPFSEEETAAYNTAHWTSQPVANCLHVQAFLLSPVDEETSVTMTTWMVRNTDEYWLVRTDDDRKEIQRAQNILADLKAKIEGTNKRR